MTPDELTVATTRTALPAQWAAPRPTANVLGLLTGELLQHARHHARIGGMLKNWVFEHGFPG